MRSSHSATRCCERLFDKHVTAGADRGVRDDRVRTRRRRDDDRIGCCERGVEGVRHLDHRERAPGLREARGVTVDDRYRDVGGVRKYTRVLRAPVAVADHCELDRAGPEGTVGERGRCGALHAVSCSLAPLPLLAVPTRVTPISLCVAPAERSYRVGYGTWRIGGAQGSVGPRFAPRIRLQSVTVATVACGHPENLRGYGLFGLFGQRCSGARPTLSLRIESRDLDWIFLRRFATPPTVSRPVVPVRTEKIFGSPSRPRFAVVPDVPFVPSGSDLARGEGEPRPYASSA